MADFKSIIEESNKLCMEKIREDECDNCPFLVQYGLSSENYGCTKLTHAFDDPDDFVKIIEDYVRENGKDKYDTGGSTQ